MASLARLSEQQFRAALLQEDIRGMRILQGALAIGLVLFGCATLFIASRRTLVPIPTPAETASIVQFSIFHAVLFVVGWLLSDVLFRAAFRPEKLPALQRLAAGRGEHGALVRDALQESVLAIRAAHILRLALREGPALFGVAICYMAVVNGVLDAHPIVGLNACSAAAAVAYLVTTPPSEERLVAIFRRHIARS